MCYYSVYIFSSSSILAKNLKIKTYETIILPVVLCVLWNMVSYITEGMQAKSFWKQDTLANIWASGEGPTMSLYRSPNAILWLTAPKGATPVN